MVFLDGLDEKTNVARRTGEGKKSIVWPVTARGEVDLRVAECRECSKAATHHPCEEIGWYTPFQETRHEVVAAADKLRWQDAWRLHEAMWIWGYCEHGIIITTMLNAGMGTANNASQFSSYEILAIEEPEEGAGYTRLQLRGPNPRWITFGRSRINPDWPLTEEGRLLYENESCALPPGATVRFMYPSCLADRLYPVVTKIEPPENNDLTADFWVSVSCDVRNAQAPWDLKYPAADGKYYIQIYWYQLFPEDWGNWQVPRETQFTLRLVALTGDEVRALVLGQYELLDSLGAPTRVLWPGMFEEGSSFDLFITTGGARARVDDVTAAGLLDTVQTGRGQWETWLDLSQWQVAETDSVLIAYRPEAAQAIDGFKVQFASQCSNCQRDLSESYQQEGVDFCTASATADLAAGFKEGCWQPNCDHFTLGDETHAWHSGNQVRPVSDARASKWWSPLWTRCSWYIEQGLAGSSALRNYAVNQPAIGGHSVEEALGGWADECPVAKVPSRWPYFGASGGDLEEYEDGNGDLALRLRYGAFWLRGIEGDLVDAWDLEAGLIEDFLVAAGQTWDHLNPLQEGSGGELHTIPVGCVLTEVYDYATSGSWLGCRSKGLTGLEFYGARAHEGERPAVEDSVTTFVRSLF